MFLRLVAICFLLSSVGFSQKKEGFITGKVVDEHGIPLMGVTISADEHKYATISNENGDYVLNRISKGKHILKATYLGYSSESKKVEARKGTKVVFILKETLEQLNQVLITGKTEKTKIETKGFAVNVVETKEASLRNIQTNELLNTTVGVKIRQNGGLGSRAEYSLNGLSGNSIRIFIDGIPISMYGSSFSLNSIPPAMIKNIEVYKGVVPGHLSEDSLGGAINIILHKGVKSNLNTSVSYGSFNTFQTNLNGLYRFKKSGFTVKASAFHNYSDNDYKVWGGQVKHIELDGSQTPIVAKRFNDAYRSTGGIAQIGFTNVKWTDQFLVGFTSSNDYKEIQHGAFMTINPYKDRFLESDAQLATFMYQKKDFFIKGLSVNINGLYGERNRVVNDTVDQAYTWKGVKLQRPDFSNIGEVIYHKYPWGSQQEGGPTFLKINRKVASVRSGISYKINKQYQVLINHVYTGLDREDVNEKVSLLENTFRETSDLYKNVYSLSYELKSFNNKLKSNLFGKYYRQKVLNTSPIFNEKETEIINKIYESNKTYKGYGFALSYAFLSNIILLTSGEKAIRLPSETEVFGDAGENVIPNVEVKPEVSQNYNLGFRFGKFHLKKHGFTISANFFTRNIKDLIGLPLGNETISESDEVVQYANFKEKTKSRGVEAQLNYSYNNNLGFNFNFSRLKLKTKNRRGQIVDVPNTPLFTMNGALRYSIKNCIQKKARLNLFYNISFTDEFSYKLAEGRNTAGGEGDLIPKQITQDLGCSYTFPQQNFSLSFDVKNLFNKVVYDNRSVQKPGRAFYLKLNYSIHKL